MDGPMITVQKLHLLAPNATRLEEHATALEAARRASSVDTPRRLAHFLGQVMVETGGLTAMVENLNYRSPERLDMIFKAVRGVDDARALIARGPEAIANRVYANRYGNGDEASGDGWRYRGSGYKQLTFRNNYRDIGAVIGFDLVTWPEMARTPQTAAAVAFAYWDARRCSPLAEAGDCEGITARINGPALLGLADRQRATVLAAEVWA